MSSFVVTRGQVCSLLASWNVKVVRALFFVIEFCLWFWMMLLQMCCMWHMRCASRMTVQEDCKEQSMVHISEFSSLRKIKITWILFFWFMCGSCEKPLLFSDCSLFFVVFWVLSETGKMLSTVRAFRFPMKSGLVCCYSFHSPHAFACFWVSGSVTRLDELVLEDTQILLTVTLVLSKIKNLGKCSFGSLCCVNLALSNFTALGPSGLYLGIS